MSVYGDLLSGAQTAVAGLNLQWGTEGQIVPVTVASAPLNRLGIEPSPLPNIFVTPGGEDSERVEEVCTGGTVEVVYPIQVSVIASGNANFEVNLPTYLSWRESIRRVLQHGAFAAITGFWKTEMRPRDVLNRDLQRDDYDFALLQVDCFVVEAARNS